MVRIGAKFMTVNSTHLEYDANAAACLRARADLASRTEESPSHLLAVHSGVTPFNRIFFQVIFGHLWSRLVIFDSHSDQEIGPPERFLDRFLPAMSRRSISEGGHVTPTCHAEVRRRRTCPAKAACARKLHRFCTVSAPKNVFFPIRPLSLNHLQKHRSNVVQFCLPTSPVTHHPSHVILDRENGP
jgi:hypothetical protein